MKNLITWGNPILLAFLTGAGGVRLFDLVARGNWQIMDILTIGFFVLFGLGWSITTQRHLAKFAALVVLHERERCAKLCEDYAKSHAKDDDDTKSQAWMMLQCAIKIRGGA